jgi:hypothetical protein
VLLGVCFLVLTGALGADEQADARAVVERAVKAMGGADMVARFATATFKCQIAHEQDGQQVLIAGAGAWQGLDKVRFDAEFTQGGEGGKLVIVINGDMGWAKKGDAVRDAREELLRTLKSAFYTLQMPYLLPGLKDKAFTLTLQGEQKVENKEAVGLVVRHPAHQDVTVLFDKETGLPIKSESRLTDPNGKEITVEFLYSDFQEAKGVKQPMKITVKGDGNEFVVTLSAIESKDKVDESEFARP